MIRITRFTAPYCAPCRALAPEFKKLEAEFTDAQFITVDVEEMPETAQSYGIRTVPTVVIEANDAVTNKLVGLQSKKTYIDAIMSALAT